MLQTRQRELGCDGGARAGGAIGERDRGADAGQARGETVMTDWELVEAATEDTPGKVKMAKTYTLTPGMAFAYDVGDLHSPRRSGPSTAQARMNLALALRRSRRLP